MSVSCDCKNCTCKDTRSVNKNEQIIAGVIVEVDEDIILSERYKTIFHGKTEISRGRYTWWYPVKNTTYARLVNELKLRYGLKVRYGIAGTMEI